MNANKVNGNGLKFLHSRLFAFTRWIVTEGNACGALAQERVPWGIRGSLLTCLVPALLG